MSPTIMGMAVRNTDGDITTVFLHPSFFKEIF